VILVDTSVWINHLRLGEPGLVAALEGEQVLMHLFVLGELACGNLKYRNETLGLLGALPAIPTATDLEVLNMIKRQARNDRGIGYIDFHLLTSTALAVDARIWTRDKKLAAAASELKLLAFEEEGVS